MKINEIHLIKEIIYQQVGPHDVGILYLQVIVDGLELGYMHGLASENLFKRNFLLRPLTENGQHQNQFGSLMHGEHPCTKSIQESN